MMPKRKERKVEPLPPQPRRDFFPMNPILSSKVVNSIFKEPINQILEKSHTKFKSGEFNLQGADQS